MNEERLVVSYWDNYSNKQMGGFFTYDRLLEEYDGNEEVVNMIWDKSYPIPDDDEVRTLIDYYKADGTAEMTTISFKELRELYGWGEAVERWYWLIVG